MNIFKRNDEPILVNSIYLFYDLKNRKLVGSTNPTLGLTPFICSPKPQTLSERYAFQMYPTHNLYYIISNGGVELNAEQLNVISRIRNRVVGTDTMSRIENESTATLSRGEVADLISDLDKYISKKQIETLTEMQNELLNIIQN